MRKITQQATEAFLNFKEFKKDNTEVKIEQVEDLGPVAHLFLHGNRIAFRHKLGLAISDGGWDTRTTKERLNGLPGVSIYQKKGQWYLNERPWEGGWIELRFWDLGIPTFVEGL